MREEVGYKYALASENISICSDKYKYTNIQRQHIQAFENKGQDVPNI